MCGIEDVAIRRMSKGEKWIKEGSRMLALIRRRFVLLSS